MLVNAPYIDLSNAYAAGGIISTVEDLYKWDQALYSDKLLNSRTKEAMFTLQKEEYGYGWLIQMTPYGKLVGHSGGIHGFCSVILRFPETEVSVIALSNIFQDVSALGRKISEWIHT